MLFSICGTLYTQVVLKNLCDEKPCMGLPKPRVNFTSLVVFNWWLVLAGVFGCCILIMHQWLYIVFLLRDKFQCRFSNKSFGKIFEFFFPLVQIWLILLLLWESLADLFKSWKKNSSCIAYLGWTHKISFELHNHLKWK